MRRRCVRWHAHSCSTGSTRSNSHGRCKERTVTPKALLYCGGGGIGDSLVASVVARALHTRFAVVDALTLPEHVATLQRTPDVDSVLADQGQEEGQLAAMLAQRAYDAAIVTWATPRTAHVPQLAGIPVRVGQSRRLYSWRFTHRVPVRSEDGDLTSHWVQILLDYARAIGCDTQNHIPKFVPTADDRSQADVLYRQLDRKEQPFAVVHPTNAIAPKRGIWPTAGWVDLVTQLQARLGCEVILSGAAADAAIVGEIAARTDTQSIAGRANIGAFAELARRSCCFVGITTGSMHVAAAVGAPTVGIFPFQSDTPERWAPLGPNTAIVRASYPCPAGERKETCPDYACIAHLDVPRILAAAESVMKTGISAG
ncbi:MAG TPA: glycosyltransferase family 9 protein [Candidatus Baltobacteraceae bacterium]|nr:glycosyltransferase family 9 protein [Candidatus Baltobacteraceae bacterium]